MKTSTYSSFGSIRLVSILGTFPPDLEFIHAMTLLYYLQTTKLNSVTFETVDKVLGSYHSNEIFLEVLLRGGICFLAFYSYYKNFH